MRAPVAVLAALLSAAWVRSASAQDPGPDSKPQEGVSKGEVIEPPLRGRLPGPGRLLVATALGAQVFDQMGRVVAILEKPQPGPLSNLAFGGPATDELYATCGDKVFRRKMRARGVLSWREPVKPAAPRL